MGRRPLTEVQIAGSGSSENEMVGRQPASSKKDGVKIMMKGQESGTPTSLGSPKKTNGNGTSNGGGGGTSSGSNDNNALSRVKSGLVTKKKKKVVKMPTPAPAQVAYFSKEVQTDSWEISMLAGEDPTLTLEYWKDLAESRQESLEKALEENYKLRGQIEDLEKEKVLLEEMVEEAKTLASMLEDLNDEGNPDESGIGLGTKTKEADESILEKDNDDDGDEDDD